MAAPPMHFPPALLQVKGSAQSWSEVQAALWAALDQNQPLPEVPVGPAHREDLAWFKAAQAREIPANPFHPTSARFCKPTLMQVQLAQLPLLPMV